MSLRHLTVRVSSHGYVAFNLSVRGRWLCSTFARHYVQYGFVAHHGQYQKVGMKVFAAATDDRSEFRFHINTLEKFKAFLVNHQVDGALVVWEALPDYAPVNAHFEVREGWVARDYQLPVLEYLNKDTPKSKFVDLQTGMGKSLCALLAIAHYGKRLAIIVKPMYLEKWAADLKKTFDICPEDIIVIKGSSQLMALLLLAKEGQVTEKAILISNKTYQNWLKLYEKYHHETLDMGYACTPNQFFELLGVGLRLIDEVHQDFHLNMKVDLYSHVPRSIALSATLINNDPFIEKMYAMVFPMAERFRGLALRKYIDAYAVHYRFAKPEMIKTEEFGGRGYSHGALEKSVMRHHVTLNNYLSLVQYTIDISFAKVAREKKKLLVFASSIAMCTQMALHFERRYPELRVRRYVEDDPYSNLFESDMVFTTLLSAGTAHDIPNLTTVILPVAVDSIQSNVQSLGRLRDLAPDPTEFLYLVCQDFPKHAEYHSRKVEMLTKLAKSVRDIFTGFVV